MPVLPATGISASGNPRNGSAGRAPHGHLGQGVADVVELGLRVGHGAVALAVDLLQLGLAVARHHAIDDVRTAQVTFVRDRAVRGRELQGRDRHVPRADHREDVATRVPAALTEQILLLVRVPPLGVRQEAARLPRQVDPRRLLEAPGAEVLLQRLVVLAELVVLVSEPEVGAPLVEARVTRDDQVLREVAAEQVLASTSSRTTPPTRLPDGRTRTGTRSHVPRSA